MIFLFSTPHLDPRARLVSATQPPVTRGSVLQDGLCFLPASPSSGLEPAAWCFGAPFAQTKLPYALLALCPRSITLVRSLGCHVERGQGVQQRTEGSSLFAVHKGELRHQGRGG